MKRFLLKSRKLILLLLLGFRFLTMGISFINVPYAVAAVPLSSFHRNVPSQQDDINTGDRKILKSPTVRDRLDYMKRNRRTSTTTTTTTTTNNAISQVLHSRQHRDDDSSYKKIDEIAPDGFYSYSAPFPSDVSTIQSESGPIQAKFNAGGGGGGSGAFRISSPNFNDKNLQYSYYNDDDDSYRDGFTATTSRIIGLTSKESDRYSPSYEYENDYDDYDNENEENKNIDNNSITQISSYMNKAKNLWDIFVAVNTAWNAIGEQEGQNQQKQEKQGQEQQQQKQQQQQQHQYNNTHQQNYNADDDDRPRRDSLYYTNVTQPTYPDEIFNQQPTTPLPLSSPLTMSTSTEMAMAEGRYIKGDPLKGYYDFVITEGSYKFWAAFQLATACLIIYSTFAAIYYSKVNPLVSDYDYVDYLGGGRSMPDDSDFVDVPYETAAGAASSSTSTTSSSASSSSMDNSNAWNWSSIFHPDWVPRVGHTMKFILESIDKIPQ